MIWPAVLKSTGLENEYDDGGTNQRTTWVRCREQRNRSPQVGKRRVDNSLHVTIGIQKCKRCCVMSGINTDADHNVLRNVP
jgi:hypothetical protein